MTTTEVFSMFGKFSVAPAKEVYGELRIAGKETSLYLRDDYEFDPHSVWSSLQKLVHRFV